MAAVVGFLQFLLWCSHPLIASPGVIRSEDLPRPISTDSRSHEDAPPVMLTRRQILMQINHSNSTGIETASTIFDSIHA